MNCPKCECEYTYEINNIWICPECNHEWNAEDIQDDKVLDSNGNELHTGDNVIVIKDLKIKGSTSGLKKGAKIKNIRLIDAVDGHDIACKVDGIGSINIKSIYVKKA